MKPRFERMDRSDAEALTDLLASEDWPYHCGGTRDRDAVLDRVASGYYDSESVRTFWIVDDGRRVGLVRLEDIGHGAPMFDLRIRRSDRGRGVGREAVVWLTRYLFEELPDITRIEATTRQDNQAMRRVFRRCGYAKEAHYRQAWPTTGGSSADAVGYAILRSDWTSGSVTAPAWDDEAPLRAPYDRRARRRPHDCRPDRTRD